MPISTPNLEVPSNPTLGCFTGAIVLREGAAAVGSTHLADPEPPFEGAGPPSLASDTEITNGTEIGEPPPYFARKSPLRSPVFVVRSRRPTSTRHDEPRPPASASRQVLHERSLTWQPFGLFAAGASVAAVAGVFVEVSGGLAVAALAAVIAGIATLVVALAKPPQAACRGQTRKR